MTTELVKVETSQCLATVMGVPPKQLMAYAIDVANMLTQVLREKKLTRSFQKGGKEHVEAAGWQLAGALMGFTSSEGDVVELADGSYEATMELRSVKTGELLAKGSARCGVDEPNWRSKPKYARRSMAFTRANGRVYSQNFRWLIELAGFAGTPAEEMEGLGGERQHSTPQEMHADRIYTGTDEQAQELAVALGKRKIDESLWEAVGRHMQGRVIGKESLGLAIDLALADAGRI